MSVLQVCIGACGDYLPELQLLFLQHVSLPGNDTTRLSRPRLALIPFSSPGLMKSVLQVCGGACDDDLTELQLLFIEHCEVSAGACSPACSAALHSIQSHACFGALPQPLREAVAGKVRSPAIHTGYEHRPFAQTISTGRPHAHTHPPPSHPEFTHRLCQARFVTPPTPSHPRPPSSPSHAQTLDPTAYLPYPRFTHRLRPSGRRPFTPAFHTYRSQGAPRPPAHTMYTLVVHTSFSPPCTALQAAAACPSWCYEASDGQTGRARPSIHASHQQSHKQTHKITHSSTQPFYSFTGGGCVPKLVRRGASRRGARRVQLVLPSQWYFHSSRV